MNQLDASVDKKSQENVEVYANSVDSALSVLNANRVGLTHKEVTARLEQFGPNTFPKSKPSSFSKVFLHQFVSPLIYILLAAAVVSIVIQEYSDAIFIGAVLLINAIIGTVQEFSAQRSADALQKLVTTCVQVLRDSDIYEVSAEGIVPGDIVLLESGVRVPADLRLLSSHDLDIDESLLTGESVAAGKNAGVLLDAETVLGDRANMAYAGTMISRGRGRGVVVATALNTELGHIAESVLGKGSTKAPLQIRMEKFTHRIAIFVGVAILVMASVAFYRGMPMEEIFLLSAALAVSVIPEGLPVALTVALAIGMRRMSKRGVIVRKLVAVEALGSCTSIATDKTGTLTVNQLTVRKLAFPGQIQWEITGDSDKYEGMVLTPDGAPDLTQQALLNEFCRAAVLANEGQIAHRDGEWSHQGDAVDVALLVMAHKFGYERSDSVLTFPELDTIPFESERLFSASLNCINSTPHAFVKGAVEKILPMCSHMIQLGGNVLLDRNEVDQQSEQLAGKGYRVIALASGEVNIVEGEDFSDRYLVNLKLIALVGIIDPLRDESKDAIKRCRSAGIQVVMITGDHPSTAYAIGRELELLDSPEQVVTGPALKQIMEKGGSLESMDQIVHEARVFARVEPRQKLDIVQSLQRNGHFVAVSGDGANDAPAIRTAQVGVAMGKSGTDVARETADLIITDDNFDSIVAGVEEGRIAYANVRKVIFLLISTGAAELVLFTLSLATGLPLPLLAVQLLWLNLVTNGIQDIALAFEPGEGDELNKQPRSPKEPVFNRLMIERVVISALVVGVVAFSLFSWLLNHGYSVEEARNGTLLLMVLFENVHVFNCRSETRSVFRHSPLKNRLLLLGTVAAQLIHIAAMYTPWLNNVLGVQPVSLDQWLTLLGLALSVLIVMEVHKFTYALRNPNGRILGK